MSVQQATQSDLLSAIFAGQQGFVNVKAHRRTEVRSRNFPIEDLNGRTAFVEAHSADHNIWFGVATRARPEGGSLKDCERLGALFADVDFKSQLETAGRESARTFPLTASAIVRSGGGIHPYWLLDRPLNLQDGGADRAKQLLQALASALGADRQAAEAARVLRYPGTRNFKYTPPAIVTVESLNENRYSIDQIEQAISVALLVRAWPDPSKHTRHATRLALAGFLITHGVETEQAVAIACRIAQLTSGNVADAEAAVRDSAAKFRRGDKITAGPTLLSLLQRDAPGTLRHVRNVLKLTQPDFPCTESGDGEFFAEEFTDRLSFDHQRRSWFVFTHHHWRADTTGIVTQMAIEAMRRRQQRALSVEHREDREKRARWALNGESNTRINNMLAFARTNPSIGLKGDEWDADPWLLGVKNGVVDLRTGTLRPGCPRDRVTKVSPLSYVPAAACPRWEQFICEICNGDEQLGAFLQRSSGYALTGLTYEQYVWILYGKGANGKTTYLETIRQTVIPDHSWAMAFPSSTWTESTSEYQRAELVGRRFVVATESDEGKRLNTEFIKSATGGEALNARQPYGRPFTFKPVAKLFLAVNHRPVIRDQSHGIWRRVLLVPFLRTFPGDTTLGAKLAEEGPGILAWAVRGAVEFDRDGLRPPPAVRAATEEYRNASDPLAEFYEDCCVLQEGLKVQSQTLFAAYREWCVTRRVPDGERLSQKIFGQRIRDRFSVEERRHVTYQGIGLRQDEMADAVSMAAASVAAQL